MESRSNFCPAVSILEMPHSRQSSLRSSLDLLQALWELLPVIHNDLALGRLGQKFGHLLHLLLAILDAIHANISDTRNTGPHGSRSAALAVLNGDALLRLHAQLLAGVEVDGRVGLAGRRVQARRGTVDVLIGEVVVDLDLLDTGDDARLGRRADDRHRVALLLEVLELLRHAGADGGLLGEFEGDGAEFAVDVVVHLGLRHLEVELLLEAVEHAAEVLADEVGEELFDGVAFLDVMFLEELVGQVGAGFKGEVFGEDEGVVAVEEDVFDLSDGGVIVSDSYLIIVEHRWQTYFRHLDDSVWIV